MAVLCTPESGSKNPRSVVLSGCRIAEEDFLPSWGMGSDNDMGARTEVRETSGRLSKRATPWLRGLWTGTNRHWESSCSWIGKSKRSLGPGWLKEHGGPRWTRGSPKVGKDSHQDRATPGDMGRDVPATELCPMVTYHPNETVLSWADPDCKCAGADSFPGRCSMGLV